MRSYTDSELLALEPLVIEPGYRDENNTTRNRHLRNPFAPEGTVPKEAARAALANRWSTLHWHQPEDSAPAIASDPFDLLRDTLAALDGTPLFFAPPECGGTAIHPIGISSRDPAAVAAWERAAIAMHSVQEIILPDDAKPAPQSIIGGIKRTVHVADEPIPNFADLPEAQRRALLKRGD